MPRSLSPQQQAIRHDTPGARLPDSGVLYRIHDGPQRRFMETSAEEVLYGGARGGGKSLALRAWAVTYCLTYPGALVILFRRTYRELEDTHVRDIQQEIPTSIAMYSPGSHNLTFRNGSVLMFRFMEKAGDEKSHDTAQYDAVLFEELTAFEEHQYTYLVTRCRSTKPWWPGRRIRSAATPLNVGHAWVKRRWIDVGKPNEIWKAPRDEGGLTRQFIPAKLTDNHTLMDSDPDYIDAIRILPYEEYEAAMGNWDVATGQFFRRWRQGIHICKPFDIPPDWERFICVDYGFNAPYCCLWFARPKGTRTAWFYREHYGTGMSSESQAHEAWQVTKDYSETIRAVILDPSMFGLVNVKGERVDSLADDWKSLFGKTTHVIRGNNERVPGWKLMREMVDWKEGPDGNVLIPPRLFVFNTLPNLCRTLPLLVSSDHNPEDVDTDGEDHAPDAARYGLVHAFAGSGKGDRGRRYYIGDRGIVVGR